METAENFADVIKTKDQHMLTHAFNLPNISYVKTLKRARTQAWESCMLLIFPRRGDVPASSQKSHASHTCSTEKMQHKCSKVLCGTCVFMWACVTCARSFLPPHSCTLFTHKLIHIFQTFSLPFTFTHFIKYKGKGEDNLGNICKQQMLHICNVNKM